MIIPQMSIKLIPRGKYVTNQAICLNWAFVDFLHSRKIFYLVNLSFSTNKNVKTHLSVLLVAISGK